MRALVVGCFVVFALASLLMGCDGSGEGVVEPQTVNSIQTIVDDMRLPHEGRPHGVPGSFDWATGPRTGMGNDPGVVHCSDAKVQADE